MIRCLALTGALLVAGAAQAQSHTPPHPIPHPHGPGHVRPDSATHAAMHARLHGSWTGTLSSRHGAAGDLHMLVARDSLMRVTYRVRRELEVQTGEVSNLTFSGDSVQWTQQVSGAACKANAVVSPATSEAPPTMNGKMQCPEGEITFSLHKAAG